VAGLARRGLDASGDVDRIPDHAELQATSATDASGNDRAGVEADADAELAAELLLDGALDFECGQQCAVSMVGTSAQDAERCQQAVADELVDVTATPVDDRHHSP